MVIIINQPAIILPITVSKRINYNHHAKKIAPEMLTGVIHLRPIKNLPTMSYPILDPERLYDMRVGSRRHIIHLSYQRRSQEKPGAIYAHVCTQQQWRHHLRQRARRPSYPALQQVRRQGLPRPWQAHRSCVQLSGESAGLLEKEVGLVVQSDYRSNGLIVSIGMVGPCF